MESYKIEFIKFALSRQVLKFGEFTLNQVEKVLIFSMLDCLVLAQILLA